MGGELSTAARACGLRPGGRRDHQCRSHARVLGHARGRLRWV